MFQKPVDYEVKKNRDNREAMEGGYKKYIFKDSKSEFIFLKKM